MAGVESYYLSIRNLFPYCRMVFAYGSAAFQQYGVPLGKMLDLIFVVDDPCSWHKANLEMNSQHYSCLRYIGPKAVSFVQELPACVYFNPLITVQGQLLKYGVISEQCFVEDLEKWTTLYISGRLHKPVVMLHGAGMYSEALQRNLEHALHTALLLSPEKVSLEDFFAVLSGLSYEGDLRMIIGEDKNKVRNIVRPQVERFLQLYSTRLEELSCCTTVVGSYLEQDTSPQSVHHHLDHLPKGLKHHLPSSVLLNDANLNRTALQQAVMTGMYIT
jgi:translocator assembly and maintenance protein 41